jgi:hypothetical protein
LMTSLVRSLTTTRWKGISPDEGKLNLNFIYA